jgi:hypothetical protein
MENKEVNKNSIWRPVLFFYARTTGWIVIPLVLAMLLGNFVQKSVGSQVLFFIIIALGFAVTCYGIYKEIKDYKKTLQEKIKPNGK